MLRLPFHLHAASHFHLRRDTFTYAIKPEKRIQCISQHKIDRQKGMQLTQQMDWNEETYGIIWFIDSFCQKDMFWIGTKYPSFLCKVDLETKEILTAIEFPSHLNVYNIKCWREFILIIVYSKAGFSLLAIETKDLELIRQGETRPLPCLPLRTITLSLTSATEFWQFGNFPAESDFVLLFNPILSKFKCKSVWEIRWTKKITGSNALCMGNPCLHLRGVVARKGGARKLKLVPLARKNIPEQNTSNFISGENTRMKTRIPELPEIWSPERLI